MNALTRPLLPCPFCGAPACYETKTSLGCTRCDAWFTGDDAYEQWNRRSSLPVEGMAEEGDLIKRLREHHAELQHDKVWSVHYDEPEGKLWGEAADALSRQTESAAQQPVKQDGSLLGAQSGSTPDAAGSTPAPASADTAPGIPVPFTTFGIASPTSVQIGRSIHGACREVVDLIGELSLRNDLLRIRLAAVERDAAVGAAIQRAAGELPDDYVVSIDVERGAASVDICSPDGDYIAMDVDGDNRLASEINAAIDAALAAKEQQPMGNSSLPPKGSDQG